MEHHPQNEQRAEYIVYFQKSNKNRGNILCGKISFSGAKHYFLVEYQAKEKIVLYNALLYVENVSFIFWLKIKVLQKYCSIKVQK